MPINYKEYPENWKFISMNIIKDAGSKCELCYAPNGCYVNRSKYGVYPWELAHQDGGKEIKIILTVHHINGNKNDSRRQNLIALCQKCHLRLDLMKHMDNRKKHTNSNQIEIGL